MTDNTELKRLAESLIELNRTNLMDWAATVEDARIGKTHTEYALAANPAAVLFLVAENELLAKTADCWDRLNIQNKALSDSFRTERDQLRAEVAGLKTGYQAYERVNAELKAEVDSLIREADRQYTTIEAYRKDAERYQWLLTNASVILDKKAAYQAVTGFIKFDTMPARTETESAIDAAMSKGEQS